MLTGILLMLAAQEMTDQAAVAENIPGEIDMAVRDPATGEFPVEEYEQNNENAGADPFRNGKMAAAFGGQSGIHNIVNQLVDDSVNDSRISDTFKGHDLVRLRRTLFEQFCYILNAGCDYSGRDMKSAHQDMGLQRADLNALVENLQIAMKRQGVSFAAQNRFLAKLAPMNRDIVER